MGRCCSCVLMPYWRPLLVFFGEEQRCGSASSRGLVRGCTGSRRRERPTRGRLVVLLSRCLLVGAGLGGASLGGIFGGEGGFGSCVGVVWW